MVRISWTEKPETDSWQTSHWTHWTLLDTVGQTIQNYIPQKYLLSTQQLDCQAGDKDKIPELMTLDSITIFIRSLFSGTNQTNEQDNILIE